MDGVDTLDTLDVGWSHQRIAICYDVILLAEEKAAVTKAGGARRKPLICEVFLYGFPVE